MTSREKRPYFIICSLLCVLFFTEQAVQKRPLFKRASPLGSALCRRGSSWRSRCRSRRTSVRGCWEKHHVDRKIHEKNFFLATDSMVFSFLRLTWDCGSVGACGASSGPRRHQWCSLCCRSAWIRSGAHPWWAGRAAGGAAPERSWRTADEGEGRWKTGSKIISGNKSGKPGRLKIPSFLSVFSLRSKTFFESCYSLSHPLFQLDK